MTRVSLLAVLLVVLSLVVPTEAETGYDLWMRYKPLNNQDAKATKDMFRYVVLGGDSATFKAAGNELKLAFSGMVGSALPQKTRVDGDGGLVVATANASVLSSLKLSLNTTALGTGGFVLKVTKANGRRVTVVVANTEVGALYGVFRLLQLVQTRQVWDGLNVSDAPKLQLRVLDHWDNLDRYMERGYSGQSLWDWQKLPRYINPRYLDYARANAALGINSMVINNVNSKAMILNATYLVKVKALANVFRPYGMRLYLTARFSAPIEIGGLKTADPLDASVQAWWKTKVAEIYASIPDFGGFLVKANSEGQPGPNDYNRTHADGANMLADALAPYRGVVMWRAFVYSSSATDRHMQANLEFQPLDGTFRDNVLLQAKNGAIDFQPREPFHPLFGALTKTPLMMEVEITKEYLGFATHLVFLGTMWEEVLQTNTYRASTGKDTTTTVSKILSTPVDNGKGVTGMAGVANIGTDINWSGSQFDQANWFAFGRLAWNPDAKAAEIAKEWAQLTWGNDPAVVDPVVKMMLGSREAVVNYMTPLGLGHQMATGHHYGPGPWISDLGRPEWNPTYYNGANGNGIGFDRTRNGTNALSQYAPEVAKLWGSLTTVPDKLLLWFHHVSWDYTMRSGKTLWTELVEHYDTGVAYVKSMQSTWATLESKVDARRWSEVRDFLVIQEDEAVWWRDASIAYFQSVSKRPLPSGHAAPANSLEYYKAIKTPYAPGDTDKNA